MADSIASVPAQDAAGGTAGADGIISNDALLALLRNDAAEVLRRNVPDLSMVPKAKVYDRVMEDPNLLHLALLLLRTRKELFHGLAVTKESGRFPAFDDDELTCGRTLGEVVTMLVRGCAKRYFHKRLFITRPVSERESKVSALQELGISLGLSEPPKVKPTRNYAPADKLYEAIHEQLKFDWQVPLIPIYSMMSPRLITKLGARLQEFRDPQKLEVLTEQSAEQAILEDKVPLLFDNVEPMLIKKGEGISQEVFSLVCQKMRLAALFPKFDHSEMVRAAQVIATISAAALRQIVPILGSDIRVFTLFLMTAYAGLGQSRYRQILGNDGESWAVEVLTARMNPDGLPGGSYESMKRIMDDWVQAGNAALDQKRERDRDAG